MTNRTWPEEPVRKWRDPERHGLALESLAGLGRPKLNNPRLLDFAYIFCDIQNQRTPPNQVNATLKWVTFGSGGDCLLLPDLPRNVGCLTRQHEEILRAAVYHSGGHLSDLGLGDRETRVGWSNFSVY